MALPSILQIRDFRRLWVGQAVSLLGDSLYFLIFLFMVNKLTGDPKMVGYVGALQAVPFLIFGPFSGVVADRYDRKKVMIWSDMISAGILVAFAGYMAVQPQPALWVVFTTAFLLSSVVVFFLPAKSASIPRLVPKDRLIEANSLSAATDSLMPLIGLGLSGSLLGQLYGLYPNAFFLTAILFNAATFVYSALCLVKLPDLTPERTDLDEKKHMFTDFKAGLEVIRKNHVLKVTLVLSLFINMFIAPFMVVHIAANRAWFGDGYASLAWFEFAFMAGMVPASIMVGKLKIMKAGLSFVISGVILGALICLLGFSPWFWPYLLLNLVAGLALPFLSIPINTYFQLVIPDEFRGRVNSTMMMLSQCVRPVAIALAGLVLDMVSLLTMFLIMGIGMGGAALVGLLDGPFRRATLPQVEPSVVPEIQPEPAPA